MKRKKKRNVILLGEARQAYICIRRPYKLYVTIVTGKETTLLNYFTWSHIAILPRTVWENSWVAQGCSSGNPSEQLCAPLGFSQTILGKIAMGILGKIFHGCCPLFCCTATHGSLIYCIVLYCTA